LANATPAPPQPDVVDALNVTNAALVTLNANVAALLISVRQLNTLLAPMAANIAAIRAAFK